MRTLREQFIEKGIVVSVSAKEVAGTNRSKKPIEKLSRRELEELMGSNRDTFRRAKGGAIRRNR